MTQDDLNVVLAAALVTADRLDWEAANPFATLSQYTPASAQEAWSRKRRDEAARIRTAVESMEDES